MKARKMKQPSSIKPTEPAVPANPLPASNLGEANQVEPIDAAEQATWQPYKASTAHAEPAGHLDERGVLEQDDLVPPKPRHGDSREVVDKDE